jgi:hypothetical protein
MEKRKILFVGCGGCGNNQLNTFLDTDVRYTGIFMNTNLREMKDLKHFNKKRNCFYIPNADGTGQNRDLAEDYIKAEAPKFAEMVKNFIDQEYVIFDASLNGGTGSKAMILLAKVTKHFCPDKSLNIVGTLPDLNKTTIDFSNTIDTWNELIDLKEKGIIDSLQFIDNNNDYTEEEINLKSMQELNAGFDVVGGKIDTSDSKRVHQANGYKIILKLNDKIKDTKLAINQAINNSMFYIPDKISCTHMIANINSTKFNPNIIQQQFKGSMFTKINTKNEGSTIIVLGGCNMPIEERDLINEALNESLDNKKEMNNIDDLKIINEFNEETKANKDIIQEKGIDEDLNNIFANPNFWDE